MSLARKVLYSGPLALSFVVRGLLLEGDERPGDVTHVGSDRVSRVRQHDIRIAH